MYTLLAVLGWTAAIAVSIPWLVRRRRSHQRRRLEAREINVLGPLVLPMPDDPRWRGSYVRRSLGIVTVCEGRLYLEGRLLPNSPQTDRYCRAVGEDAKREALSKIVKRLDDSVQNET